MSGTPPPPSASDVLISPISGLTATNVQQALEELQNNKANNPTVVKSLPVPPTLSSGGVAANPNVPHIDQPQTDPTSLRYVLTQVRQGVESLGGHRGTALERAVTLQDLVSLGLVTAADIYGRIPDTTGQGQGGPPPSARLARRRVR